MALVHQETWVRHGTNGIGISDHQNRYSNGVRVANWVENECGDALHATTSDHVTFTGVSTVQADFIQRERDPDGNRVTALGSSSNVQMPHGPDQVHNMTHMTSTYDLSISHVEGPRRVDTLLWSGVTKVDNHVPTAVHAKTSLLEKKKQQWASAKESNWQTAYSKQYIQPEAGEREMRGVIQKRKDDSIPGGPILGSFSKDRRPHLEMGLRGYS